jgi:hypothetical protein
VDVDVVDDDNVDDANDDDNDVDVDVEMLLEFDLDVDCCFEVVLVLRFDDFFVLDFNLFFDDLLRRR